MAANATIFGGLPVALGVESGTGVDVQDTVDVGAVIESADTPSQSAPRLKVEVYARAALPTAHGTFVVVVFRNNLDDKEHVALVRGRVRGRSHVPVRLHSECLTGDVFSSQRCDCREQLDMALSSLGRAENGVVLYMRQEGRGIGLGNKIRAYTLQEQGLDTFEANMHLGFDADLRDYRIAALMLEGLAVESIDLATNNPDKVRGLEKHGVQIGSRIPIIVGHNRHNQVYLRTKAESGHLLNIENTAETTAQMDSPTRRRD